MKNCELPYKCPALFPGKLQRQNKGNQIRSTPGRQIIKRISRVSCLTGMELNRVKNGYVEAFVHESVSCTNPPKRCCTYLVSRGLSGILHNSIASSNVVKCKVAEGVDYFVAEGCWNGEGSAID